MGKILSEEECSRIKKIREEEKKLKIGDWLCEGTDDRCNVFFSNELDASFNADWNGNIVSTCGIARDSIYKDVKEFAKLEGQISRICYN